MSIEIGSTLPQEISSPWERARFNAVAKPEEVLTSEDLIIIKTIHMAGYISGQNVEQTNRRVAADCAVRKIYSSSNPRK